MTREDKELLFKDLCARLPYNVICQVEFKENGKYNSKVMLLSGIFTDEAYFTKTKSRKIQRLQRCVSSLKMGKKLVI